MLTRQSHEVKWAHEFCSNECIIQHNPPRILEIQGNQKGIYKYLKQTHHLLALIVVSEML